MATCVSIASVGWMKSDIRRLQGDLRIAEGKWEESRRETAYKYAECLSVRAELTRATAWLARRGAKKKAKK